eukprot:6493157-Pyramimonas_sp.AAC.1
MLVVFLAKGDDPSDASAGPARKSPSTRPLSMGCNGCKLIAAAVAQPLPRVSLQSAHKMQSGGVPGRSVSDDTTHCEADG